MGWSIRPTAFMREVEEKHAELVFTVAMEFWRRVTVRTPVQHGVARANWHMTLEPSERTTEGNVMIPPTRATVKGMKYPMLYVQNNLPYIIPLEYGHSSQAPGGMFRITAEEFR